MLSAEEDPCWTSILCSTSTCSHMMSCRRWRTAMPQGHPESTAVRDPVTSKISFPEVSISSTGGSRTCQGCVRARRLPAALCFFSRWGNRAWSLTTPSHSAETNPARPSMWPFCSTPLLSKGIENPCCTVLGTEFLNGNLTFWPGESYWECKSC